MSKKHSEKNQKEIPKTNPAGGRATRVTRPASPPLSANGENKKARLPLNLEIAKERKNHNPSWVLCILLWAPSGSRAHDFPRAGGSVVFPWLPRGSAPAREKQWFPRQAASGTREMQSTAVDRRGAGRGSSAPRPWFGCFGLFLVDFFVWLLLTVWFCFHASLAACAAVAGCTPPPLTPSQRRARRRLARRGPGAARPPRWRSCRRSRRRRRRRRRQGWGTCWTGRRPRRPRPAPRPRGWRPAAAARRG